MSSIVPVDSDSGPPPQIACGVDTLGRSVNVQSADQPADELALLLFVSHFNDAEPECSTIVPGFVVAAPQNSAARLVADDDDDAAVAPSYTSRQSPES